MTQEQAAELIDEMMAYEIRLKEIAEAFEDQDWQNHRYLMCASTMCETASATIFNARNYASVAHQLKLKHRSYDHGMAKSEVS